LKQAIDDGGGLHWLEENKLTDLDFADDIVLCLMKLGVECSYSLKNRRRSKQSGSPGKTKLMQIGIFEGDEINTIQAEGEKIESVQEFCYLGIVVGYQEIAVVIKKLR